MKGLGSPDADKILHGRLTTDGGSVSVPLEKQMWGDELGMCADKFGILWMVNIAQPQP